MLDAWDGAYGISVHEDAPRLYRSNPVLRKKEIDLACLKVEEYEPEFRFILEIDTDIVLNQLVCCFEYGTTEVVGRNINLSPANRLGNVTRIRDLTERFGLAGDHMLELSFPALQGASGAPVILARPPFLLWGVVKANVARELLPAQIERIYDEEGRVEEDTRFLMPQALAIHVMHVREMLLEVERS